MSVGPAGFAGARWLVTGTASGIGDRLARLLTERGAEVFSLDRHDPSAPVARHLTVDLADPAAIDAALDQLPGRWDAVVNGAGLDEPDCAATVFAVNFLAARHICEAMIDRMVPGGALVNVSSTSSHAWPQHLDRLRDVLATDDFAAGLRWFAEQGSTGPAEPWSQEALVAYTKIRGPELLPLGLRMNAVSPGPVDTPLLAAFTRTMGTDYVDEGPRVTGRHLDPLEIARVVAFLGSPESSAVSGHNIVADRGLLGRRPPQA